VTYDTINLSDAATLGHFAKVITQRDKQTHTTDRLLYLDHKVVGYDEHQTIVVTYVRTENFKSTKTLKTFFKE